MILQTLAEVMQMGSGIREINRVLLEGRGGVLGLRVGGPGVASGDGGVEREGEGWAGELERVERLMGDVRLRARNSRGVERGEEEEFGLLEEY